MRQALALLLAFVPALGAGAQSSDPAYVDSPHNRAVPDPARADHAVFGTAEGRRAAEEAQVARSDAERVAEAERNIQAQMQRFSDEQAAANAPPPPVDTRPEASLPPVGGRSLAREVRSQLGQGLLRDAAGVLDARMQRERGTDAWDAVPPSQGADGP